MVKKFIDDEIIHMDNDIEKIQKKPTMYVSHLGEKGAAQLAKEIINNAVDECINSNSPANKIDVLIDEKSDTVMVKDNGRGISEDKLHVVCTILQSGSKFERSGSGGGSAGEYGVGLTACNALSSNFEIISHRYGKEYSIQYSEGKMIRDVTVKSSKSKDNGTVVIFSPSKYYLDDDAHINGDMIMDWLEELKYLMPKDITIKLDVIKRGSDAIISKKYKNMDGMKGYIKDYVPNRSMDIIHFQRRDDVKETYRGVDYDRHIGIEVAFTYDDDMELKQSSFCNFIRNADHGTHADAVKNTLARVLLKFTKATITPAKNGNVLEVISQDVFAGLNIAVYLQTDMTTQFSGQTKEKLNNPGFTKPINLITEQELVKYFSENTRDLKKIIDRVKANAKARIASIQTKNSVIKGETNNFDEHLMKNFTPANNIGKNDYRELFIIEGLSAGGSVRNGLYNRDTQALYSIRGVPKNTLGLPISKVTLNDEFRTLIKILGCNIGDKFNMDNLRYKKIIILADSDADGNYITSLLCTFFISHLRPIVEAGMLYKATAPLYKLGNSDKPFVLNKLQYVQLFEKKVKSNIDIMNIKKEVMSDKMLEELLYNNRQYLDNLMNASNHMTVKPLLLEYILMNFHNKDFEKNLIKKYPELTLKDGIITGIVDMNYHVIRMNQLTKKRELVDLASHISSQPEMFMYVKDKRDVDYTLMSLGEFLMYADKYRPSIVTRYKGLGELDANDLMVTTMDPRYRILIRLTIDDIEKDMEQFKVLHGNKSEERKQMMTNFQISREELDN